MSSTVLIFLEVCVAEGMSVKEYKSQMASVDSISLVESVVEVELALVRGACLPLPFPLSRLLSCVCFVLPLFKEVFL